MAKRKTKSKKASPKSPQVKFGLVGVINTGVDFTLLYLFIALFGWTPVAANVGSTSVALSVSYILNKRVVFGDTSLRKLRQFLVFVAITLFGLWVIQGAIITTVPTLIWMFYDIGNGVALFVAKVLATIASLLWNYFWYSRVVFDRSGK